MRRLKKYVVFILSFVLLYTVFQVLSGWLLTVLYTPDPFLMNSNAIQQVEFGQVSFLPYLVTLLVATLAYIFSQKLFASKNK